MTQQTSQSLPEIVKGQSTYKMIIPEEVERKIRYLLNKFPSTEWSGILFCSHEGSFEDGSLTITCRDIFPMDLGDATFTSFNMDPDVASYMAEHEDLFDCTLQLIHSHHNMSAFFSGTDLSTLRQEGANCNCFVSLIVNNAGTYCAAVTRRVRTKKKVAVKILDQSYDFFGDGPVKYKNLPAESNTVEEEVIEYFMLDIEREIESENLDYLDKRFDDIKKTKEEERKKKTIVTPPSYTDYKPKGPSYKQLDMWEDFSFPDEDPKGTVDKEGIHAAVVRMVTCSMIVDVKKIDLKQWITKHMKKIYDKLFPKNDMLIDWYNFIVPFIVENYDNPKDKGIITSQWKYQALVADAMYQELHPYAKNNEYIEEYCNMLLEYTAI